MLEVASVEHFSGGDRAEIVGETNAKIGFFQHIQQAGHRPATSEFGFEPVELLNPSADN